ncbi:hypothetical protein SteCoe_37450 [Stentor coeruleus]|uniref:Myb-like DNA-binding domain containing protein n=1 Tax=Stentor coeruleus TaxID=5963 RepID=A0A1R2AMZ2_9CILI|nr:hypothetical protein SteCoe_37450 [Stentor coeruleus]
MDHRAKFQKIWTAEEDLVLKEIVLRHGKKKWKLISTILSLRIGHIRLGKQCRERWINNLDPQRSNRAWSESEIKLLFLMQNTFGNSWSQISRFIPGKSQNAIKNCFYSTIRRNIRRYNKGKLDHEKIKGPIDKLLEINEVRLILATEKKKSKTLLMKKQLSDRALELVRQFSSLDKVENQREMQPQESLSIDELFNMDFDEVIDLYFDNQDNFLQPTKNPQQSIYDIRISEPRVESQTF